MNLNKKSRSLLAVFKQYETSLRQYIAGFFITPQDVEDISQETFLRTYESNIKNNITQPKSYMFRVATNLIMSEFRRSSYKLTDYIEDLTEDYQPIDVSNLENDVDTQKKLALFCESLASLPEQCRKIMVMRKVAGLSIKQISKRLNMPVSTVNYNLAKGMAHCDDAMDNWRRGANQGQSSKHQPQPQKAKETNR